jgi:hypothetical protein
MIVDSPLWADVDAIKLLIGFLFVVLPLLAKLINMFGNQEPAKRVAPPVPPPVKPRLPPKAANPELNTEVEEFLRRAAERRTAEQRREAATVQKPQPATSRQPAVPRREEPKKPPRRKPQRQAIQAEVLDDVKRGAGVAEHVAQHFKPQHQVLERPSSAAAVDQADEAMQQHLHSVFDHQVGTLARPDRAGAATGAAQSTPREAPVVEAADLAGLLTNPQTVRHAIILNEILTRPEHRW